MKPTETSPYSPSSDAPRSVIEHLAELRKRLLIVIGTFSGAFFLCFLGKEQLLSALAYPLTQLLADTGGEFIYTSLSEAFTTYLRVCLVTAMAATIPMILLQIWLFIAPALYKAERKMAIGLFCCSPLLFVAGSLFAYHFIIPHAWAFFLAFQDSSAAAGIPLKLHAKISDYLSLTSQILFAFGMSFQLPLVILILGKIGFVQSHLLLKGRKYALLLIMIFSAVLTPPDVLSMLGLTVPLYILYELSAQLLRAIEKPKKLLV